jgi:hypothetical protein
LAEAANPEGNSLYRLGGTCAATIAVAYLITIPLYAVLGAPPTGDGETWLNYLAGKTTGWWVILGLSVLTDLLFVPVAFSLYFALRRVNRTALLVATAFVFLFVALDLAVTWANYGALIVLANHYASAATAAKRLADAAAANYPAAILSSRLEAVYRHPVNRDPHHRPGDAEERVQQADRVRGGGDRSARRRDLDRIRSCRHPERGRHHHLAIPCGLQALSLRRLMFHRVKPKGHTL